MSDLAKKVSVVALRRLLVELKDHRPDICIRYRLIGKMWAKNFSRIIDVTNDGVVLHDETTDQLINIPDVSHLMQFELDKTFQSFQAHFHYDVVVTDDW